MNRSDASCDLLLVNPPWIRRQGNIWREIGSCSPPLGLAYLAAYVRRLGYRAAILDMEAERLMPENLPSRLVGHPTPRFLGITVNTSTHYAAQRIAAVLRQVYPHTPLIVGGVHPTILPEETLDEIGADIVVRGEGEKPLAALLTGEPLSRAPGITFRVNGVKTSTELPSYFPDLDELPPPAYDLLPIAAYRPALGSYRRLPAMSMVVSRGCPGRCTFCFGSLLGNRWRFFSAARILDDIKRLVTDHGIREISFYDDTFTANPAIRRLCETIIQERLDITWVCFARADTVDPELLRLMKRAGCHQVMYGLESADKGILKNISKRFEPADVARAVRWTKQARIDVRLAIMFGNPGETNATMRRTIEFVKRLNPDILIANITTPYPGTAMFAWAKQQGCLRTVNWDDYTLSKCVMDLPTVSCSEVEAAYARIYREFYLRPSYLANRLLRLRSRQEIALHLQSLKAVISMHRSD